MVKRDERRQRGGRSSRYERRRTSRNAADADAPQWTGAAAMLAAECFDALCKKRKEEQTVCMVHLLTDDTVWKEWDDAMQRTRALVPAAVARAVLEHHMRWRRAGSRRGRERKKEESWGRRRCGT